MIRTTTIAQAIYEDRVAAAIHDHEARSEAAALLRHQQIMDQAARTQDALDQQIADAKAQRDATQAAHYATTHINAHKAVA